MAVFYDNERDAQSNVDRLVHDRILELQRSGGATCYFLVCKTWASPKRALQEARKFDRRVRPLRMRFVNERNWWFLDAIR